MTDSIVQEVREARADIAAEFGHDRAKFWAWARAQQESESKAKHQLPTGPNAVKITSEASKPGVARKGRARPAGAV